MRCLRYLRRTNDDLGPEARAAVLRPVCEIENRGCLCVAQGAVLICRKCPSWHPAASHAIRRIIAMFRRAIEGVRPLRTRYAIEYYVDGDVALLSIDELHKERLVVFDQFDLIIYEHLMVSFRTEHSMLS